MGLIAGLVVMSNIFAVKIISIGPFIVPAGVILFSMTFLITDFLSEYYGKRTAQKAVWIGFLANILFFIAIYFITNWTGINTDVDSALNTVLSMAPRIIFASLIAYIVSQHFDVWYYHVLKNLTGGRALWFRNNMSTMASQLIDSSIFILIAFYGILPVVPLIMGQWAVKMIIALIDTPFLYILVSVMNRDKVKVPRKKK